VGPCGGPDAVCQVCSLYFRCRPRFCQEENCEAHNLCPNCDTDSNLGPVECGLCGEVRCFFHNGNHQDQGCSAKHRQCCGYRPRGFHHPYRTDTFQEAALVPGHCKKWLPAGEPELRGREGESPHYKCHWCSALTCADCVSIFKGRVACKEHFQRKS